MEEHARPSSSENLLSENIKNTSLSLPCSDTKPVSLPSPSQMPSTKNEKIILPSAFICLFPPISKASLSPSVKTSDKAPLYLKEPIARNIFPLKSKAFNSAQTRKVTIPSTFMCLFPPVSEVNLSPSTKD
ncbi:hypothetical protein AVEN_253879-1 [Araneus ventricosus]|uniref:Uncharacterized protein n=1 Tax=Araneus ventricosus TaxID=182803 RepID=A0A4Y2PID5_ARAVE|nr:hypothetical protein AVEN_253879-1 [Araneus ventricosus]